MKTEYYRNSSRRSLVALVWPCVFVAVEAFVGRGHRWMSQFIFTFDSPNPQAKLFRFPGITTALSATKKQQQRKDKLSEERQMSVDEAKPNRKRSHMETMKFPFQIQSLRLEAIFYPKFENETGERVIRNRMLSSSSSDSYLEVSTKHSGSLLLWSGGSRFYSKNSLNNQFSASGEVLLRQHFRRLASSGAETDLFQACSDHVQEHRLTLSFEVVTSVLADHGDRPRHDFLILTAVANRAARKNYFYSTPELLSFAQRFRLPHNDVWIFREEADKRNFFAVFDRARETGTASTVIPKLAAAASTFVPSMYPHAVFQGDIMEGIVVRLVTTASGTTPVDWDALSHNAQNAIVPESQAQSDAISLRDLRRTAETDEDFHKSLQQHVDNRSIERFGRSSFDLPALTQSLVDSPDRETGQIARLIRDVSATTQHCAFAISCETKPDGSHRYVAIVHVFNDQVFHKYHKNHSQRDDLPLFRGFSIELGAERPTATASSVEMDLENDAGESLMLKMKFLPYMIRTFGCRNGLKIVERDGPLGFSKYTSGLLSKWGISDAAKQKWLPFFRAWGSYASECMTATPPPAAVQHLPVLSASNYLDHLAVFTQLYEATTSASAARGLLLVVALDAVTANTVADYIAKRIDARRLYGLKTATVDIALQAKREGFVCSAVVDEGPGPIGKLLKHHKDVIRIVFFQCSEEEVSALLLSPGAKHCSAAEKTIRGKLRGFRSKQYSAVYDLPRSSLLVTDGMDIEGEEVGARIQPSKAFEDMVQSLHQHSDLEVDERPGLLVFFPGIPGCGKSACVSACKDQLQLRDDENRTLTVLVGDKTKGKYWPQLRRKRLGDTPGIVIADKNAPPAIWSTIGDICAATRSWAVPVIPDALETTRIEGVRTETGEVSSNEAHTYPFSLRFLAVCMARVLDRVPESHDGRLDVAQDFAARIVTMFFSLYRHSNANDFVDVLKERMSEPGGSCFDPIMIPFFRRGAQDELPADVHDILVEALQYQVSNKMLIQCFHPNWLGQFGLDRAKTNMKKCTEQYATALERRLRECISLHRDSILSSTVDLDSSVHFLTNGVQSYVAALRTSPSLPLTPIGKSKKPTFIKLTSVDISAEAVYAILMAQKSNPLVSAFFETVLPDTALETALDNLAMARENQFVTNTHITLAFAGEMSQEEMGDRFSRIIGKQVQFRVNALYWNDRVMALGIDPNSFCVDRKQTSSVWSGGDGNCSFPHVTVWFCKEARAVEAKDLLQKFRSNDATTCRVELDVPLDGVLSFWKGSKSSRS